MSSLLGNTRVLLIVLLALALSLLLLQGFRLFKPLEDIVAQVLLPLQKGLNFLGEGVRGLGDYFQELATLKARNQELQALVDRLMIENVRLREVEIENTALRQELDFKRTNPDYSLMAAEVIGRDPSNLLSYIIIDRGQEDGITVDMPVVTSRGLIGRVTETSPHSAKVLLIVDPSSSVSALLQSSRATGLVQGRAGQGLVMRYIEQEEEVKVGDLVLTSGLGANFPKRMVIGQVTEVRKRDIELYQEAEVKPSVDFNRLETVLVITNFPE